MKLEPPLERVYAPILEALHGVEEEIRSRLASLSLPLPNFLSRGKRLRPAAVLFTARVYDGANKAAITLAAAIELIHASSLIHDDVIDEAKIRREELALNIRFNNTVAVLAGDYIFAEALLAVTELMAPDITHHIVRTVKDMVRGELLEEVLPLEERLQEKRYLEIISLKTASLFRSAFTSGGHLAGLDRESLEALSTAGHAFGMAYQILDDTQDLFDGEEGADFDLGKFTLPVIGALHQGDLSLSDFLGERDIERVKERVARSGGFTYALRRAEDYIREGKKALKGLKVPDIRINLENFFDYLLWKSGHVAERIGLKTA